MPLASSGGISPPSQNTQRQLCRDFTGGPLVKIHFQCTGRGPIPGWGTKIPPVIWHGQKIIGKKKMPAKTVQSLCKWVYLGVWCLFDSLHLDFFLFKIICFWLRLIFVAAQGLPLVV